MKKRCFSFLLFLCEFLLMIAGLMVSGSCAGTGRGYVSGGEPDIEEEAREILVQWQESLQTMNIDRYMTFFRDDALKIVGEPDGIVHSYRGVSEIREDMEEVFARFGDSLANHTYPPAEYRYDGTSGLGELVFSLENPFYKEALRFEKRNGEVKIAEHWIFYRFFHELEVGDLTAWADEAGDRDGLLNEEEQTRLFIATHRVMHNESRKVDNPLDEFFDWNCDGSVDWQENNIARQVLLRNRFRRIDRFFPELARQRLPPFDRDDVNIHDANWIQAVSNDPESLLPSGPIKKSDHHLADMNKDGLLTPLDYEFYQDIIFRAAATNPAPVLFHKEMPAFIDDIYHWSDQDCNGEVSDDELGDAGYELFGTIIWSGGMPTWTPFARFFDRNRDSVLSESEQEWALGFIVDFLLSEALEKETVVLNWNTRSKAAFKFDIDGSPQLSADESGEIRKFIVGFREEFGTDEDAEITERRWLDSNADDIVENWEVDLFRDMLFSAVLRTWFLLPEQEANSIMVRTALDVTADTDANGILSMEERSELIASLWEAHEVISNIDREIDFNTDGRISLEEISRARDTGYIIADSAAGERSITGLENRSSENTNQYGTGTAFDQASVKVKAVSTWGSNLAVLGVRDLTETIAPAQSTLLISFLENAFVNYGNVSVVDRQNLEKIMEEYQYQASALVNEETAVEIGKLSGADNIAIGNISRLSDIYYFHIKVINVKSGKIIGSSISEGSSEKDFLNMCNSAVRPLF